MAQTGSLEPKFATDQMLKEQFSKGSSSSLGYGIAIITSIALCAVFFGIAASGDGSFHDMVFKRGFIPYIIAVAAFFALGILFAVALQIFKSNKNLDRISSYIAANRVNISSLKLTGEIDSNTCPNCGASKNRNDTECKECGIIYSKIEMLQNRKISGVLDYIQKMPECRERNRVWTLLKSCKNIDSDFAIRQSSVLSELDKEASDSLFTIPQYLAWAVPMLGFLGTVLGISQSLSNFDLILKKLEEVSQIKSGLAVITAGLGVAFDTTLLGIIFAIIIGGFIAYLNRYDKGLLESLDRLTLEILQLVSVKKSTNDPVKAQVVAPATQPMDMY